VAAKRTAFGTFGGALKNINQTQLQTTAAKAALDAAGLKGEQVDTVIVGNVIAVSVGVKAKATSVGKFGSES